MFGQELPGEMGLCPVVVLKLTNLCLLFIVFSIVCQQSNGYICQKCCDGSSNYSLKFMLCILHLYFALVFDIAEIIISNSVELICDTVLNWVSAIKGNIHVKNFVTVGNIFCCMLLLRKHKDTFVGFTHC